MLFRWLSFEQMTWPQPVVVSPIVLVRVAPPKAGEKGLNHLAVRNVLAHHAAGVIMPRPISMGMVAAAEVPVLAGTLGVMSTASAREVERPRLARRQRGGWSICSCRSPCTG